MLLSQGALTDEPAPSYTSQSHFFQLPLNQNKSKKCAVGDGAKGDFSPEQKGTGTYRLKAPRTKGQTSFGGCSRTQNLVFG